MFFNKKKNKKKEKHAANSDPFKTFDEGEVSVGLWSNESRRRGTNRKYSFGLYRDVGEKKPLQRTLPYQEFENAIKAFARLAKWLSQRTSIPADTREIFAIYADVLASLRCEAREIVELKGYENGVSSGVSSFDGSL